MEQFLLLVVTVIKYGPFDFALCKLLIHPIENPVHDSRHHGNIVRLHNLHVVHHFLDVTSPEYHSSTFGDDEQLQQGLTNEIKSLTTSSPSVYFQLIFETIPGEVRLEEQQRDEQNAA